MAIRYVATTGNDSTGTGDVGSPYRTIVKAQTVASNGDTIYVEPGTYSEDSGSQFLSVTKSLTIQTDPANIGSGKAVLQAADSSRVVNVGASSVTFVDFVFDAQGVGKSAVTLQGGTSGQMFVRCDVKNIAGGSFGWRVNSANGTVTLDKCTATTANGNASTTNLLGIGAAGWSVIFKGCTASGINAFQTFNVNSNTTLIQATTSADGTRNTVANCATGFRMANATITTVDIEAVDFSGVTLNPIFDNNTQTAVVNSFTVKYCSFTNQSAGVPCITTTGTYGSVEVAYNYMNAPSTFINSSFVGLTNPQVHDNTIVQVSATHDPISINACTGTPQVYNNTITTDNTAHVIIVGVDGTSNVVSNTASATSTVNLGDVSGRKYTAQTFTFIAASMSLNSPILAALRVKVKKVGTPVGTMACQLYADSTGSPGSLLSTSEFSMLGANQSATSQWVEFWFPDHPVLSYGTAYWIVVSYGGTIDGSNYVALDGNAVATNVKTSADGVSWSTGASSVLFQVRTAAFDIVDPKIFGNKITAMSAAHCCILGATLGGKVYRNQIYGGGIPLVAKLVDGSGANSAIMYDNLVLDSSGTQQAIRDKGSRGVQVYHNTVVNLAAGEAAVQLDNDFESAFTPQYNGQPSRNAVVQNNVLYCNPATSGSPVYVVGGSSAAQPTCVSPTIDRNNVYVGANASALRDIRSGSTVNYATFPLHQSVGFDVHGKNADPGLVNESTPVRPEDFVPPPSSAALDMGADLRSIVASDYFGAAFTLPVPAGAIAARRRSMASTRGSSVRSMAGARSGVSTRSTVR